MPDTPPQDAAGDLPATPLEPLEETEDDLPDPDEPTVTRLEPPVDLEDPADSRVGDVGIAAVPGAPPVSGALGAPTLPPELPFTPAEESGQADEDEVR